MNASGAQKTSASDTRSKTLDDNIRQLVTFTLANQDYGIDIMQTQDIHGMLPITPIPNSLDFVVGVVNLRGRVIPILDLKKRFNLYGDEDGANNIVVLTLKEMTVGILIDKILKVVNLQEDRILPPPPVVAGIGREYITGVGRDDDDRLLIILDIDKLLSHEELEGVREIQEF